MLHPYIRWALIWIGWLSTLAAPSISLAASFPINSSNYAFPLDSLARRAESYSLRHSPRIYIADTFKTLAWSLTEYNLYKMDVSKLTDTFRLKIHDPAEGKVFTFPVPGRVTSPFGPRNAFGFAYHFGTDIALHHGDTVVSAMAGVVRMARFERGYGNFVIVAHDDGLETLYGHLSKILVKPGQAVSSGELIGLGGNTGWSTGNHLHFEMRFLGQMFDTKLAVNYEENRLHSPVLEIHRGWFGYVAELSAVRYHYIRPGDNLGFIARRYGTSIGTLCRLNGIGVRTILRIGRPLRVN